MVVAEKLIWTEDVSMYNAKLDEQHKYIFELVNQIIEIERLYPKSEQFAEILSKISDYGLQHFRMEESLMQELQYPKLDEHKKDHNRYLHSVAMFNINFKDVNHTDPASVLRFVRGWWHGHIMGRDLDFSRFIRNSLSQ